jgi:hypothetical protein
VAPPDPYRRAASPKRSRAACLLTPSTAATWVQVRPLARALVTSSAKRRSLAARAWRVSPIARRSSALDSGEAIVSCQRLSRPRTGRPPQSDLGLPQPEMGSDLISTVTATRQSATRSSDWKSDAAERKPREGGSLCGRSRSVRDSAVWSGSRRLAWLVMRLGCGSSGPGRDRRSARDGSVPMPVARGSARSTRGCRARGTRPAT